MIAPWVREELEAVDLGDLRLDARLELLLSALGNRPHLSIPAACRGRAELEAAYRFFDNDKVTFDKVLQPHIAQTLQRLAEQKLVLLVQDTTEMNLTRPEQEVAGVGELDGARRGFLLHAMQAFTPEGTPLGSAWATILNRTEGVSHASAAEKNRKRKQTPIEDKESMRWLTGLREARAIAQQVPGVQCVCVADSEADIYELFAEERGDVPVHWLIRACENRALQAEETAEAEQTRHLRERALTAPVLYEVQLQIRGHQAKTAVKERGRGQSRASRQATVEVRATTVTLRPPWRCDRQLPTRTVHVVLVHERNPPSGEPAVEWILVTTLPIDTLEQVRRIVEYYGVRWCIEIDQAGCRSSGSLYLGGVAA